MLTLAVKMESDQDQPLKQYLVSLLLSRTTLNHIFVPVGHSWIEQVYDKCIFLFDLICFLTVKNSKDHLVWQFHLLEHLKRTFNF